MALLARHASLDETCTCPERRAWDTPPTIISLETGLGLEEHLKNVIAGVPLEGYGDASTVLGEICNAVADINARFEDRMRTAPVPFCGDRFKFGLSAPPRTTWKLSSMIEEGLTPRDAVASTLRENFGAIFNGDGYSQEW